MLEYGYTHLVLDEARFACARNFRRRAAIQLALPLMSLLCRAGASVTAKS